MSSELLPCPFCGNDSLEMSNHDENGVIYVKCNSCGVNGPPDHGFGDGAIHLWNTREISDEAVAWQYRYRPKSKYEVHEWRDCNKLTFLRHKSFGKCDVRELFAQPKEAHPIDIDEIDRCWLDSFDPQEERHVVFATLLEKYILAKLGIRVIGSQLL